MVKKTVSPEQAAKRKATMETRRTIHMVTENYRVIGIAESYNPEERKISKGGIERWEPMGYHSDLWNAINAIAKHVSRVHMDDLIFVATQLDEIKAICMELRGKVLDKKDTQNS